MATLNYQLTTEQALAIKTGIDAHGIPADQATADANFGFMAVQQANGTNTTLGLIAANTSDLRIINFLEDEDNIDAVILPQIDNVFSTINLGVSPNDLVLRYVAE